MRSRQRWIFTGICNMPRKNNPPQPLSRTLWRPCYKTYRRFLHKKERGLPAFRWQTSWRRWRDSNSRAGFEPTYRISSADPSTAWVHLQIYVISLVPTRRPIQPVEIGKNNRIEQATLFNIQFELGWNPHGSKGFSRLALRIGNLISNHYTNLDDDGKSGTIAVTTEPQNTPLKVAVRWLLSL